MSGPVEKWLVSGKDACIGDLRLRPKPRTDLVRSPLMIQRGQATAFWLKDEKGGVWILKKFHSGKMPHRSYLQAVGRLLPKHAGLIAGTDRRFLCSSDLNSKWGSYKSAEFAAWLDGTLLMPRVSGSSWFALADEIRDSEVSLTLQQRLTLCRELSEAIRALESAQTAHRDLSAGNVIVDPIPERISLIDFDCLFHHSLSMPSVTTSGTEGYIAPFVYQNGSPNPTKSWCPMADRFALALLNSEFLAVCRDSPFVGDGGLFQQADLNARRGRTIDYVRSRIRAELPAAGALLDRALSSRTFGDCPSPSDWIAVATGRQPIVSPSISLADLGSVPAGEFERILSARRRPAPAWLAPRLDDLPKVELVLGT